MSAVMISIQPQWVERILTGKKTIEIRKTKPNINLPCKVYIYETKGREFPFSVKIDTIARDDNARWLDCKRGMPPIRTRVNSKGVEIPYIAYGKAKVVAEFTLNKITTHKKNFIDFEDNLCYNFKVRDVKNAGFDTDALDLLDFDRFIENYGKGKPLYAWHIDNLIIYDKPKDLGEFVCRKPLKKPPQSWCYVED